MWFLIKAAFWFSLVLIVLPVFGTDDPAPAQPASAVDVGGTVSAATEAIGYIGAICLEKPDVCSRGIETFSALGHRAKEGARVAYQLLDAQFGEPGDPVTTGTVSPSLPGSGDPVSEDAKPWTADAPVDVAPLPERIPVPEKRIEPARNRAS